MDEQRVDRLCGLIARLRQQHTAVGLTLDEIEACLADPAKAPTAERSRRPAERVRERAGRPGDGTGPVAG